MDNLNKLFSHLSMHRANNAIKIQKIFRGFLTRRDNLPMIMYYIKKYLKTQKIYFSTNNDDGRINSSVDEDKIINMIIKKYRNRIKKPKIRMWYDLLAYDYLYGWIPINIKITTMTTNDNTGNLAMCVHSYTDGVLNFNNHYENGKMSIILFDKLKHKKYNRQYKKDYYFLVLNKNDIKDIIINSVKGLNMLCPNINNLPYQVCWNKNKKFEYKHITKNIEMFIECLQKPRPNWKEIFMSDIRTLKL